MPMDSHCCFVVGVGVGVGVGVTGQQAEP